MELTTKDQILSAIEIFNQMEEDILEAVNEWYWEVLGTEGFYNSRWYYYDIRIAAAESNQIHVESRDRDGDTCRFVMPTKYLWDKEGAKEDLRIQQEEQKKLQEELERQRKAEVDKRREANELAMYRKLRKKYGKKL